jgi:hypothetical protein
MTETKVCSKCGIEKHITQFYSSGRRCKSCKSAYSKEWVKNNKCRKIESDKKYRASHKEVLWEKSQTNEYKERKSNGARRRYKNSIERMLWKGAKKRAKNKHIDFTLRVCDIIIPKICPVLGIPIFIGDNISGKNNSPSLDRIDNTKGYVKENVQVISWRANRIKGDASLTDLLCIVDYMNKLPIDIWDYSI